MSNNDQNFGKSIYDTVVVAIKSLDIINAQESLYLIDPNIKKVLWIQFEINRERVVAAKKILDDMQVKTIHVPNPYLYESAFYHRFKPRSKYLKIIFFGVLLPFTYLIWIIGYIKIKRKLSNIEKPKYFFCDPVGMKIMLIAILKPDNIVFFDGGKSTVTWKLHDTFAKEGGFGILKGGLHNMATCMPRSIKRKVMKNCHKEPVFITAYSELFTIHPSGGNIGDHLIENKYFLLKQAFEGKEINKSQVLILGTNASGSNPDMFINIRKKIENHFEKQDSKLIILYKPHDLHQQISSSVIHQFQVNEIEICKSEKSIEFALLNEKTLPKAIISWNSSASIILKKTLPDGVRIINLGNWVDNLTLDSNVESRIEKFKQTFISKFSGKINP